MITKPLTFLSWCSHFITKWRGLASFIKITYIISIVALFPFSGTFGAQQYCLDVAPQQDVQSSGSPGWGQ